MELKQLSCGIWILIENGIRRYTLEHGRKPFALILHPAHLAEFCQETETDDDLLDGIAIMGNPAYAASVLMNEHGDITER